MTTRADVEREARTWVGTPFQHQGRVKGVGIDCAGLIVGVGKALQLMDYDVEPQYGRRPSGRDLQEQCDLYLARRPFADLMAGNIALLGFTAEPQHLGILTAYAAFPGQLFLVHAFAQLRACVEHALDDRWRRRLRGVYSYKALA